MSWRDNIIHATRHELPFAAEMELDWDLTTHWLEEFLRDEVRVRRGFERAVVGVSGGVDSSVTAYLAARALGPDAVYGYRMPYESSSQASLDHAQLVADDLGIHLETHPITNAVDGLLKHDEDEVPGHRVGNVCARMRMIVLFDQAFKLRALPLGTGNKSERMLGYFTWHGDDAPPINPLGDLYKTQVWGLARHLGVPSDIVEKPATADLIRGQTDESDLGITYVKADLILHGLLSGYTPVQLADRGFSPEEIEVVRSRVDATHWKRQLPTTAMLSDTAIGEYYLRPVDYVR
ncbi:MAG: NAD+ synthase [Armatimonadia bacterium]|nr:NAD+ synthase [Armatimonadia bacterium]